MTPPPVKPYIRVTAEDGRPGTADADGAAGDLVFGPDEHVVDVDDGVRRHGEADALEPMRLGVDGGVHADDWPVMSTSGPPELPGLMAASVWMKRWNWSAGDAAGAGSSMERFLAETMPAETVLREAEGAADGEDPVADLRAVGVAELDGGEGLFGVDLDDGDVGVFIDADYVAGRPGRRGRRRDRWRA
jgi:hypothetical protein